MAMTLKWVEKIGVFRMTGFVCILIGFGCVASDSARSPVISMIQGGAGTGAVSQLDVFEVLEERERVTHDELLAVVLLAGGRRADGSWSDRMESARRAGLVSGALLEDAGAEASPGDLARLLLRAQGIAVRDDLADEAALSLAARRSLVPADLGANDPLTGAVTVRALAAAGEPARPGGRLISTPASDRGSRP